MRKLFLVPALGASLWAGGLLLAHALGAQSPIGEPVFADPSVEDLQGFQTQTLLANGDLLAVWEESPTFEDPAPLLLRGRRFNLEGAATEILTLARGTVADDNLLNPLVAPRTGGGFLLTFIRDDVAADSFGCRAIAFDDEGDPLSSEILFAPDGGCGEGLVALADGTFATTWLQESDPSSNRRRQYRMFARLSSLGELISRPRRINPDPLRVSLSFGSLSGNANGDMTLAWDSSPTRARSFDAYGGALPPLFFVGFTDSNAPAVAVLPNGNRIFAGLSSLPGQGLSVTYQRFGPDGAPLGRMRPAQAFRHELFGNDPSLAADRAGNFVVAWSALSGSCYQVEARLFRAGGVPVSKEILAGPESHCGLRPQVSFGNNGTFALSWLDQARVSVAWFSASPADEPCLTRSGHLFCDTGRTGGTSEIDQPNAPAAFDAQFLADFDGDGRADPCHHSGTTFRCDLDHRGRGPRARVQFGEPTDLPLLGDVDGDGRAEACVRRGDLLACDTGHDGGRAELEIRFGDPSGTALFGDLDGDRRDDLCVFRDGVFSCDTAHDGRAPERTIRFGQTGDLPVLGDFDGDGRDDPCVLRGDLLLCDTKHDGGEAEARLRLAVQPGDGIVMGNLDGL